jgi:hypothetical protein
MFALTLKTTQYHKYPVLLNVRSMAHNNNDDGYHDDDDDDNNDRYVIHVSL